MAQCTCAFRLSLFNSSYFKGGAAKSRCGKASGKGKAADREDVLAGFLGQRVSREDLPAEHRDQAHCQPGFGADADLQVMRQLCGIECSAQEKDDAWRVMMRQLAKLPDKFHRRPAQVAANFSMHAFNSLTPSAQLEHSWTCKACPQDAQARELFGTAVLHGNPRGRPAKNKRGAARDREGGDNQTNGTEDDPLHDTPLSRVRIETSLAGWSKEEIGAATPALLLKTNDNQMLLFDLDRATHGTTRQLKLGDMQMSVGKYKGGKPKLGNEHFNLHWDAWVEPLVAAIEKLHGGSLPALIRRRHLARSLAADASARAKAERDVIGALEQAEVEKAALHIQGNRQSFARYNRARTIRCKETNSQQGLRRAKMTEKAISRNRMGSIDTWSFGEGNASYADRFELVVGCTPVRYAEIVDPKALLDLRTEDAEEYAAAQREVRETRARKTQLCVLLVLEALAREVGCTPEALAERLAGTLYVEVNLADVARRLDGPLAVGSKTVRSNAGQCLKDLLHRHSALNVGLLSSPDDRGVHTTRRANATVQVGGRAVCVPQGPTVKQVRAAFEEHWVKSGLVNLGVPIVKWEFTWSPGMDGEWLDTERDQSGRLLPKMEMLPPLAEKLREDDVLRSMPDFQAMPMEHVALHLQRAKLPARGARETEISVRARARTGLLHRRSARTQPKPTACTHCCRSLRCPNCLRCASACECARAACEAACEAVPACRECVRGGRAAAAEVRADLAARGCRREFDYPAWALAHLIELEADDDAREDLVSIKQPASLPDETPQARERRLALWQNRLQIWVWSDDSPIAKKTMMIHLWGWLYHPQKMRWSREVGQMCMQPQLSAIMNVSATLEDTRFYNRAIMLDLHTLADGITLADGTHINIDLRVDKYDGQQGAKDLGCSSGAAHWSCACCGQNIQGHPDLVACLECEPRGLRSLSDRAALCAQVPGFESKIDLRASCKDDLVALVKQLGGGDVMHLNKPAVLAKAQSLTMGQVGDPAIKGGLHLDDLIMLMGRDGHVGMEGVYDFSLHATTGQTKEMLRRLAKLLSTSDRAALLAMQNKMFGDKCAYTGADVRLRLFALQWMVTKLGLVSAQAGRGAHMLHACNYWARLHPVCFRVRYADWHNNYHGCVLRGTALFYLYAHELRQAAPPGKSKGRVDVLWLTYFHQAMHATEHLQYLPPCLNECERCEAQFKDVREQAKSSSNHLQSMQAAVVIGNQMEKYVKAEYACEGGEAASDRRFHKHYEQSYGALDEEDLKFGFEHWGLDGNWGWLMRLLAPFTVHRSCWRVEGTGDDAVFVLLCGDLSLWLPTPRLDYALCTLGDVRARAAAAYVQLQQQLTDPLERRVLLGEGLPARAPLAVPRQAPATAARRGGDEVSSEEESESEPEGSGDSDDQGSDGGEGGEGGEHAADGVPPPDHYELTCLSYSGDVLTVANPRGYGVTVERWERPRQGGTRTITYAGEHMLDAEGVRKREGHGTERCELYKKGAARMQGQWRANCFYGLGERQSEEGAVHRGEWVLQSASGESVLQGWGEKLRFADAPAPYEYGKYVLDAEGSSVLAGDCVDLPGAHTEQLEAAVEAAAQAAARGEKAVRMAAVRAHGGPLAAQQAADAGGSGPAVSPPPLFAAPEGAAARMMRKALTDAQQHLVDAYEAARKRDDDDAQTTRALHAVLDAIALLHIPDKRDMDGHRSAGGQGWNGTEEGVGTLSAAVAKAVWLRWVAAEKVWQDHNYNLERYIRARASGPVLLAWLGGQASLPAFDIPAALKRAKLTPPKPQLPQRGQNAAQRTSGAGQVRAATTAPTSASALLQPTAQGNLNSQIDDLTAKLAALKKRKDHERREMEKKEREKRAAAAKRAPVQKHQREQRRR